MEKCVVIGGGGHAKVVIDILLQQGLFAPCGATVAVNASDLGDRQVLGVPIVGDDSILPEFYQEGVRFFILGIGATGDNSKRQAIFDKIKKLGFKAVTAIHPRAVVAPSAKIGPGSVVMAGSIVNPGAVIGSNCIINTGAIVEHDCLIDDHAHIAPGACLSGGVRVGLGAHVGAGAVVRQNIVIGVWAVAGAGAAVVDDILPTATVTGVPARVLKKTPMVRL